MSSDPLRLLWDALDAQGYGPRGKPHDFRARCPGHGGDNPRTSLRVGIGADGRAVLWCHAHQCDVQAITAALGLGVPACSPRAPPRPAASAEACTPLRVHWGRARGRERALRAGDVGGAVPGDGRLPLPELRRPRSVADRRARAGHPRLSGRLPPLEFLQAFLGRLNERGASDSRERFDPETGWAGRPEWEDDYDPGEPDDEAALDEEADETAGEKWAERAGSLGELPSRPTPARSSSPKSSSPKRTSPSAPTSSVTLAEARRYADALGYPEPSGVLVAVCARRIEWSVERPSCRTSPRRRCRPGCPRRTGASGVTSFSSPAAGQPIRASRSCSRSFRCELVRHRQREDGRCGEGAAVLGRMMRPAEEVGRTWTWLPVAPTDEEKR